MKNEINMLKVVASLFWKFMERSGTQGIHFVMQIILARLLLPEDYGVIALVLVFTSIAAVFVESGFNAALIQKKDADEADFSSVFYLSLAVAFLLYAMLFLAAPFIAQFYNMPEVTSVFRVLAVILVLGAVNSIQNAFVSRNLQFKMLFFSNTGAILVSGFIGIYMAYAGYGVWALVWQQVFNQLLIALILWFTVKWRPKFLFSADRLRGLFSYGWMILATVLINRVYDEMRSLIVGKMYTPAMLGFYNRGRGFPAFFVSNIDGTIQSVMFPLLSSQQENVSMVKDMMRRSIVTSSFLLFPMMVGLAIIAKPLTLILLTDKWLPVVPFIQIFCGAYAFRPIQTANLQAIKALGYSDTYFKLGIIKVVVGIIILVITVFFGVYAIAFGRVISALFASFINAYPNKRLLAYSYKEQWSDISPSFLLSVVMGIIVYSLKWFGLSVMATLLLQVCVGGMVYFGMAWFFRLECLGYLLSIARKIKESA